MFPKENHRAGGNEIRNTRKQGKGETPSTALWEPQARITFAHSYGAFGRQCRSNLKVVPIRTKINAISVPHLISHWLRAAAGEM